MAIREMSNVLPSSDTRPRFSWNQILKRWSDHERTYDDEFAGRGDLFWQSTKFGGKVLCWPISKQWTTLSHCTVYTLCCIQYTGWFLNSGDSCFVLKINKIVHVAKLEVGRIFAFSRVQKQFNQMLLTVTSTIRHSRNRWLETLSAHPLLN